MKYLIIPKQLEELAFGQRQSSRDSQMPILQVVWGIDGIMNFLEKKSQKNSYLL